MQSGMFRITILANICVTLCKSQFFRILTQVLFEVINICTTNTDSLFLLRAKFQTPIQLHIITAPPPCCIVGTIIYFGNLFLFSIKTFLLHSKILKINSSTSITSIHRFIDSLTCGWENFSLASQLIFFRCLTFSIRPWVQIEF